MIGTDAYMYIGIGILVIVMSCICILTIGTNFGDVAVSESTHILDNMKYIDKKSRKILLSCMSDMIKLHKHCDVPAYKESVEKSIDLMINRLKWLRRIDEVTIKETKSGFRSYVRDTCDTFKSICVHTSQLLTNQYTEEFYVPECLEYELEKLKIAVTLDKEV